MPTELCLDLQIASEGEEVPPRRQLQRWARAALEGRRAVAEISLRIVDTSESRQLNRNYRKQDKATNVLSFPADLPPELKLPLLGDLVICAAVVAREARQQGKNPQAHWAHMLVHGTLHLLGYDHELAADARIMERLETDIITGLGFPPPYQH